MRNVFTYVTDFINIDANSLVAVTEDTLLQMLEIAESSAMMGPAI